jgi:hypothetical protein
VLKSACVGAHAHSSAAADLLETAVSLSAAKQHWWLPVWGRNPHW